MRSLEKARTRLGG